MRVPYFVYIFNMPEAGLTDCLVVRRPEDMPLTSDPRALLEYLDGAPWQGSAEEASAELARRIEERAAALSWPSLALIRTAPGPSHATVQDALTWCAAASKQVGQIILLGKEPNLERLKRPDEIILHFPLKMDHP
ncbi:MAG: hypothetical protein NZR01_02425 [Bryobacteraceae bacterium]|nr:hypothetical protein [Bryobacteraceae bacterium]